MFSPIFSKAVHIGFGINAVRIAWIEIFSLMFFMNVIKGIRNGNFSDINDKKFSKGFPRFWA